MTRNYQLRQAAFAPAKLRYQDCDMGPVTEHYFDAPAPERATRLLDTLLNENVSTNWRSPRIEESVAEDTDGPTVMVDGVEVAQHTKLVSASFAVHPMFGCGHVLRTDGRVAAFWNGETTKVVHLTNLRFVRVTVSRCAPKVRTSARDARVAAALAED